MGRVTIDLRDLVDRCNMPTATAANYQGLVCARLRRCYPDQSFNDHLATRGRDVYFNTVQVFGFDKTEIAADNATDEELHFALFTYKG